MIISPMDEYLDKYHRFKDILYNKVEMISLDEDDGDHWIEKLK